MTVGSQPSALAAAVNPGLSSEHAAAEHVRNATLTPLLGARGSGVVAGMLAGSVSSAAMFALAWVTPLPALLAVPDEEVPAATADEEVLAVVEDEELHAEAAATHAATRMPKHAFR